MLMDILDHWYIDFISRPNFYLNISMFSLITTTVLFGIVYTIISKLKLKRRMVSLESTSWVSQSIIVLVQ